MLTTTITLSCVYHGCHNVLINDVAHLQREIGEPLGHEEYAYVVVE